MRSVFALRPAVLGYGVAVLAFAAAVAGIVRMQAPVSTLMVAVIVSTWFGGIRPGILTAALSVPATAYFLLQEAAAGAALGALSRVAYFVAIAAFIIWVVASERRAAESLRRDMDTIPAMAWTLGADGRLEFLNQRWLDYAGLTHEQAIARANDIIHPDDSARILNTWREKILVTGEPYDDEMRLRRADGEYRSFLVRTVPLRDAKGKVLRWYGTSTDIEDLRRAEQALRESADRQRQLSHRLLEVQEEERRHLARELHDEFGQLLAAIALHLHAARGGSGDAARSNLDQGIGLLEHASAQVRSLALELRPMMLEAAGLDGALRWLAEQHLQQTGTEVRIEGRAGEVSGDLAIACFRVAQEALTNVVRHARAHGVWIDLQRGDGKIELTVRDDGVGFDVAAMLAHGAESGHLGLLGMRERVQILGGSLEIDSSPGRGARIRASLPALDPAGRFDAPVDPARREGATSAAHPTGGAR